MVGRGAIIRRRGLGQNPLSVALTLATQTKTGIENPELANVPGVSLVMGPGGTFNVTDASGNTIDCNQVSNVFNSACWGVFGGSTGTPLNAAGQVDCSQLENLFNGNCNLLQFFGGNMPLAVILTGVVAFVLITRR
jgi:hypothetical protein